MSAAVTLAFTEGTRPAVTVNASGLPAVTFGSVTGIVQRSTDGGIRYTTVRGLAEAVLTAGAVPQTYDWEYAPDVVNTYQAGVNQEAVDSFGRTVGSGGWGSADTGQAWDDSNVGLSVSGGFGRITHASANTLISNRLHTPTNAADFTITARLSVSAASITGGPMTHRVRFRRIDDNNHYRVGLNWQVSGALTLDLARVVGGVTTALDTQTLSFTHSGSSTVVILRIVVAASEIKARAWLSGTAEPNTWVTDKFDTTFTGGSFQLASLRDTANTNTSPATLWADFIADTGTPTFLASASTTPTLGKLWLKSVMRSFLNMAPTVVDVPEPERSARGDIQYVIARTLPIAQTELMTGRRLTLGVRVPDLATARQLEYLIASGDVLFVHAPTGSTVPTGYFRVDGMSAARAWAKAGPRTFALPLIEVAAPGPDVVTAQSTWDTVLALYGTWAAVVAAVPTWEALLTLVGNPSEVIVP